MGQLANAPLRTARQLQKLKEIRKVKAAIRWHERERRRRQKVKHEAWESKQTVLNLLKFEKENVANVRKRALFHARQDWRLGPLRPNRAVGYGADKYGALTPEGIRRPNIPVRVQKNRNEVRERKGLEPEYPIVARAFDSDVDRKFFPIVPDDRVVVIRGREKDKIGVVADVFEDTHEVVIRDLNKVCKLFLLCTLVQRLSLPSRPTVTPAYTAASTKTNPNTKPNIQFPSPTFVS